MIKDSDKPTTATIETNGKLLAVTPLFRGTRHKRASFLIPVVVLGYLPGPHTWEVSTH